MYDYILFDLDGTLTDPKVGITTCVQHALKGMGIEEPDLDKLEPFIGPPLKDSFMQFYGLDSEQAEQAIKLYRERFSTVGLYENEVYPGIPQMLQALKAKGKRLAISSSKPTVYVEQILKHFEIHKYFDIIVGSELDGRRTDKSEVVEEALRQLLGGEKKPHQDVVIVGDRKFDVEGGQAHDITTVAVSYGYGPMEELKEAKPEFIVRSVPELQKLLLRGSEDAKYEPAFNKGWAILFPVLIAYFVQQIGLNLGMFLIATVGDYVAGAREFLLVLDAEGNITQMTGLGASLMMLICYLITGVILWKMSKSDLLAAKSLTGDRKLAPAVFSNVGIATLGVAYGVNILFNLVGFTDTLSAFEQLREQAYATPFVLAVLIYCIAAPLAENFLFRGILYNRLKKYGTPLIAAILSSLLFGLYNGNLIAGCYGFVISLLVCFVYERTGKYAMAVLVHMLANFCAYSLTYTGMFAGALLGWLPCVLLLGAGILGIVFVTKHTV
ncbi:MAG: HAD hydrolase-like protein [Lachnospiraceae bacterium]|nr:HAD hydrolase-like protein [Lachnospiraceae bacterium]